MKDLIQKRSEAAKKLLDIIELAKSEERSLTVDERSSYDAIVDEINSIDETSKREKQAADLNAIEQRQINTSPSDVRDLQAEARAMYRSFLEEGVIPAEARAMSSGTGETGGFLIPEVYAKQLREVATANSAIRQLATILKWSGDGAFPVITGFGETYLVGENPAQDVTEAELSFDQKKISGYQLMYMVNVPKKLIYNNDYGLEALLPQWWGKSLGAKEENYFINGTGDNQPMGLIAGATVGAATAAANAITGDDIIDWFYALKNAYRNQASWIFADATVKMLRKIKTPVEASGSLQYLWAPGLGGAPDTLHGRPVHVSDAMPAFATKAKVGLFGDISQYQVVEFGSPEMLRDPYTNAGKGQVRFIGHELVDAVLPLKEAVVTCTVA